MLGGGCENPGSVLPFLAGAAQGGASEVWGTGLANKWQREGGRPPSQPHWPCGVLEHYSVAQRGGHHCAQDGLPDSVLFAHCGDSGDPSLFPHLLKDGFVF